MLHLNTTYLAQKGKPRVILTKAGASNTTSANLVRRAIRSFDLRLLTKLCIELNCTPNDLLTYTPSAHVKLPENHPLNALLPKEQVNIIASLGTLTTEQIQQIQQIIKPDK
ncbi:MAG: helix-turn-helix domain-containing protein [Flavobacteriales bacterium]